MENQKIIKPARKVSAKVKTNNDDLAQIHTELANDLSESKGFEDAQAFMTATNAGLQSPSPVTRGIAKAAAAEWASQLLLLCLRQEIEQPHSLEYIENLANKFDDGYITEGNGVEYVLDLLTGSEEFVVTDFNPTTITNPVAYGKYMAMYQKNTDGTITETPQSYKFKKTLTIQEHIWFPYFTSGKLRTFIANTTAKMIKSFIIYKYNKMATLITTMPISKIINGTATNLFDCLSKEILPTVSDMTRLNQTFSIDNTNYPNVDTLPYSDMLMFVPLIVKNGLMHGVQSQLFNAHLVDIDGGIPKENVIVLNDKINFPTNDSGAKITVTDGTNYLPDNTIIVMDKNAIKHIQQIDMQESQAYANNLTLQLTLHVWGLIDYLPWRKAFKYVNDNLLVLPAEK